MKRILLTLASVLFATTVWADSSTDLASLLNSVQTMRATFNQTIYDNHGKAIQNATGSMALQRPGKFRWDVKKPIPQLIIANGDRIWIYDPDLQQVTIRVLTNAAGDTPALLLSRVNVGLQNEFKISELPKKSDGWRWFKLIPRKKGNMFESVEMGFAGKEMHEMRLNDSLGHTTVVQYKGIQANQSIASNVFIFKAPADIDVIDETKKR